MSSQAAAEHAEKNDVRNAQYCTFTYNDGARLYDLPSAPWHWLDRELSSNVAGETGAVFIYHGALAAMRIRPCPGAAQAFAEEHRANEAEHLRLFEMVIPASKHTALLPVWRVAGWTLGFLPTLLGGPRALYVTVEAVETFVEEHYNEQIELLRRRGDAAELVRLLQHCCEDEVHHKEDAALKLLGTVPAGEVFRAWWALPWAAVVRKGSQIAAEIARRV